MNELIEVHPGKWICLAGPRALRITLLTFIARLAENGPVRVLDGGNQFNAYRIARALYGRSELLEHIHVSRMFTCYQVLASLEKAPSQPAPFIIMDMLHTFFDETIHFGERRRLLEHSLPHLARLSCPAGALVSLHPPAQDSPQAQTLMTILNAAAAESLVCETPASRPPPLRLF